ncbi:MAG: ABC transporter ATP-binding protein [Clostridia bacterium]|nr:ABC transporter ATP-binding protein [Clostridia bacterium]
MSQSVSIKNVVKLYGDFRAVDNVSLDIRKGEFFTLLGPSGCGKTTLLRMIAGFNTIEDGEISFDGKRINEIPANKRDIGMVFQNYAVFPHMTVGENVGYGLKARGIRKADRSPKVKQALEQVQILDLMDRMPNALSGGQQQRVALARAFVIEPSILLMDEPLSNLDAKLRVQMRDMIRKLQTALGITTIYVTHDQEEALAISDRIAVMKNGHVMQVGRPDEIYRKPENLFVANFIGNSNQFEGTIDEITAGNTGTLKLNAGITVGVPLRESYKGAVTVAIRPEYLKFDESGIPAVIRHSTFLGDFVLYELELADGQMIFVNEYGNMGALREVGTHVHLSFVPEYVSVYKETGEVISC